jgi:O-antigen biosynthesis protein
VTIPLVSVIIVNYNVKDFLQQCLESIKRAKNSDRYEIIVVDNNSNESPIQELQPLFPNVIWIPLETNIGFGRANNVGLARARGTYIFYLNPDTIVSEDTIDTLATYLESNPTVGLAGCKVLNADGTFQLACRRGFPTPWVAFCKLFGLAKLFPTQKIFAGYNLTYRSTDETYPVDALIGACMMGPRLLLEELGGFDPDFFMYGEDLDLCYRVQKRGYAVMYVHTTQMVHYKGESTKRSTMNEVKVFYRAMHIFAEKHFAHSHLYLFFLKTGIYVRATTEYLIRNRAAIYGSFLDVAIVLVSLGLATTMRFGSIVGFPEYAYPMVPMVVPCIVLCCLYVTGEHVEYTPTVRRCLVALSIAFFVMSSLTYFFKEFAFSRGVVLMTIGFSGVMMSIWRIAVVVCGLGKQKQSMRNVLFVGINDVTTTIANHLRYNERNSSNVVGVLSVEPNPRQSIQDVPTLGSVETIVQAVRWHHVHDVIVTDATLEQRTVTDAMMRCSAYGVRFHRADSYNSFAALRIVNHIAGAIGAAPVPPLSRVRVRLAKRACDVAIGILCLVTWPLWRTLRAGDGGTARNWWLVIRGSKTIVGLYPDSRQRGNVKIGMLGLAHLALQHQPSAEVIERLNDFYVERYSFALDLEILVKYFLRNRGSNVRI